MEVHRTKTDSPVLKALGAELPDITAQCFGCVDCDGLCHEVLEALVLPDTILARGADLT